MKRILTGLALASALVLTVPAMAIPQDQPQASADQRIAQKSPKDMQLEQKVKDKLKDDRFKNVKVDVLDQVADLTGNVDLLADKMDAANKARGVDKVDGVRNHIQVTGKQVSDAELQSKLSDKLRYDRMGYGNVFNALMMKVENGVVTLTGEVRTPVDKASALAEVENTPGVKGLDEDVKVSPPSPADDAIRIQVARAIYGSGSPLSRYANDPQAPIRIVVNGGHVALYGVVDSTGDKAFALSRAKMVPGTFGVEDHLVVNNDNAKK